MVRLMVSMEQRYIRHYEAQSARTGRKRNEEAALTVAVELQAQASREEIESAFFVRLTLLRLAPVTHLPLRAPRTSAAIVRRARWAGRVG